MPVLERHTHWGNTEMQWAPYSQNRKKEQYIKASEIRSAKAGDGTLLGYVCGACPRLASPRAPTWWVVWIESKPSDAALRALARASTKRSQQKSRGPDLVLDTIITWRVSLATMQCQKKKDERAVVWVMTSEIEMQRTTRQARQALGKLCSAVQC